MRKARIDVINPATGQRVRVPIVDIGPGPGPLSKGVAVDLTPNLHALLGNTGDQRYAFKLVPNAGPDVNKNHDLWQSEQAAIAQGIDSSSLERKRQVFGPQFAMREQSADEAAQAQKIGQAGVQRQDNILSQLPEQQSPAGLYKRLGSSVEGVSDARRLAYREQVKQELTKYAQDYYGETNPEKAFARATADANLGTVGGEVLSKIIPNFGQADVNISRFLDGLNIDEKRVNQ